MGRGGARSVTFLFLAVACCACAAAAQEPNTDASFVARFYAKLGVAAPPLSGAGQVCSWPGVSCDGEGRVLAFAAAGMGLSGPIPEDTVGKLARLQSLDLSANRLTALPNDLWELGASLRALNLSRNAIRGTLPNNVANFARLQLLDVSHNAFSGALPPALASIAGLRVLNASHNRFQGQVPSAGGSLVSVDLSGNALDGDLPDLSPLRSLAYLNLSGNQLRGSIIGAFQEPLRVIDLSNNRFSSMNFSSGYSGSSLLYLDLSSNELLGEFGGLPGRFRSLRHMNLAFNKLSTNNLLASIGEISALEYLNLSSTGLHEQIPGVLSSRLSGLKVLDLSRNNISGVVPDMSSLQLRVLDLSVNNLTGEIPVSLVKKLASMERFNFSYNNLTVCASDLSPEAFAAAFARSRNDCPIAVNLDRIKKKGARRKGMKLALAIVLTLLFSVLGLVCLALVCRRKPRKKRSDACPANKPSSFKEEQGTSSGPFAFQTDSTTWVADVKVATSVPVVIFEKPLLSFTFADLLAATSNFDRGTLLAEGRFGPVYTGSLPGGIQVAVKVLVHGSAMADVDAARELERLGRIKHSNLVPLTGYCLAGGQRIAIYEYIENGNLHNLLHDLPLGVQTTEDWSTDTWEDNNNGGVATENITPDGTASWSFRHKIALGSARALAFLHHGCIPQIVHRDVKASSIYFDYAMEPRLSDFGLSMIAGTSADGDHSPGYAPPEFSDPENATATAKSDVYSFGIVLFELVTGKKPLGDEYPDQKEASLVSWARAMVKANQGSSIIDPKIRDTGLERQMDEALRIAYLCTAELPSKRPAMQQIVGLLKDIEPRVADEN